MFKRKNLKKYCGAFLAVFLFISAAFPFTASASTTYHFGLEEVAETLKLRYNHETSKGVYSGYISFDNGGSELDQSCVGANIRFNFPDECKIDKGDTVTVKYAFSAYICNVGVRIFGYNSNNENLFEPFYVSNAISDDGETVTVSFTSDYTIDSSCNFTLRLVTSAYGSSYSDVISDCFDGIVSLWISSIDITVQDESTGLLNSIINWLQSIIEKIKALPSEIGSFITSLGESISGFFSDLWNNLKSSFSDIGNWFVELGNNISSFFTSLGDRINGFFEVLLDGIKEFFEYLFKPSDDFFEKLQEELDEYLTEHLGAVYQVPEYLISELTTMYEGLSAASDYSLIITMPDISFTLHDTTYTLCDSFSYDLLSSVNSLSSKDMILTALNLGRWLITFGLAVGLTKMVYKRIINKVGVEGGDEL